MTKETIRKMNSFMAIIDPILYDLKHGNLKRVAKSNFCSQKTMFSRQKAKTVKSEQSADSFLEMSSDISVADKETSK